mgnify:CR=1 FL=1
MSNKINIGIILGSTREGRVSPQVGAWVKTLADQKGNANYEIVDIKDSLLVKTLVHNYSHDPETPEVFFIRDTLAMDYANIHGAPTEGAILEPFATVDLTTMHDCVIGAYSYIQAGEINHLNIAPGTIWVNSPGNFNFYYRQQGLMYNHLNRQHDEMQKIIDDINTEVNNRK